MKGKELTMVYGGKKSHEMLDYLLNRRSVTAQNMIEPAPNEQELEQILTAGARVPDHGKLSPWYFLVFQGNKREVLGTKIEEIFAKKNLNAKQAHLDTEAGRFTRAPLVIAVVSRIRTGKPPMWEQMMSAGASCMNIVLAANGCGYVAQWLTEWYAFDDEFRMYLGLDERDTIAGFIHIGSAVDEALEDRPRPDLSDLVTYWEEGVETKKGENYNSPKFGLPKTGFDLSKVK